MSRPSNESSLSYSRAANLLVYVERVRHLAEEFQKMVEEELRRTLEELSVRQARRR